MKINDLWQRALKTFVQAFLGVLIPQIVMMLNNYADFDWTKWTTYLPLITGALAAGISAAWNGIINATDKKELK
jgi:hypothetical protein